MESSASAGSYRREMLGMKEIHVFLLAVEEFYKEGGEKNRVSCDNKGALFTFAKNGKQVPAAASNADVQRVQGEVKRRSSCKHILEHVKGHQGDYKRKSQLSLAKKLNNRCNKMAKSAVIMAS